MKLLCFGTFARILRVCKLPGVTDVQLVGSLTKVVDPICEYGESEGTAVSRLLSCNQNLSNGQKRRIGQRGRSTAGTFESGYETNRLSNVIQAAQKIDKDAVAKKIAEDVIPLLDVDKKALAIPAILGIIKEDESLDSFRHLSFEKYFEMSKVRLLRKRDFVLSEFLASVLLYTVVSVKNTDGKSTARVIDAQYVKSFEVSVSEYSIIDYVANTTSVETVSPGIAPTWRTDSIKAYLEKVYSKYDEIKTLLYLDQPKSFYSFYVCSDIQRRLPIKERFVRISYKTETLVNPTAAKIAVWSKYVILAGTGGIGKSMMLRHLLLQAIENYDASGIVPIFIPLKDFDDTTPTAQDFIYRKVNSYGTGITQQELLDLLNEGKCLLLFDGLDEINTRFASLFEQYLEAFIDCFPANQFIISSRPNRTFVSYNRFSVLWVRPFTKAQALELIDKLEFRPDDPTIKSKFRKELDASLFVSHREFAENPLLLTIMLMTFEQFAEVPSKMHIFYREAFVVLSQKHDASKGAYKRVLKTELTVDKFADYFAEFCSRTYHDEKFELTDEEFADFYYRLNERNRNSDIKTTAEDFLYDLCTNLCLMYMDSGKYHFTHRSFQEYFCALYFSRQKDRNLQAIGNFFENRRSRNYGDKTFPMLYDMIPAKIDEYIFIPFLSNFLKECEQNEGYWTFLNVMYPQIIYEKGETNSGTIFSPVSYLYEFIKRTFFDSDLDLGVLPFYESLVIESYGYMEDEDSGRTLVNLREVPSEYIYEYGEPNPVGWVLEIDIEDVRQKPYLYNALLDVLDSEDFALKKEYRSVQLCLDTLKANLKPKGDSLFDLFG